MFFPSTVDSIPFAYNETFTYIDVERFNKFIELTRDLGGVTKSET